MKKIPIVLGTLVMISIFSMPVSAKVNGILTKDNVTGKYSQYSYSQLVTSAEDSAVGINSPLYDDFKTNRGNIAAFHDDVNGFVNYKDIVIAAEDSAVNGNIFDINEFTSNASKDLTIVPSSTVKERIEVNGQVVDGNDINIDEPTVPDTEFGLESIL